MKKLLLTSVLITLTSALAPLVAQNNNGISSNYIEISARAQVEVTPDEIYTQIKVEEGKIKGNPDISILEKKILAAVKNVGVDINKDVTISDLNNSLEKYLLRKDKILNTRTYIVKLNNSKQLIKLFNQLEKDGVYDISIIRTAISDINAVRQQAMAKAAEKAKANASVIAETLGRKLGKALTIQCYESGPVFARGGNMLKSAAIGEDYQEDVSLSPDFEKIRFEQNITVKFELE